MGGQNRLKFKTDIINNNDIYTESRMYPPARVLTGSNTTLSGYNYGDGEYIVSESSTYPGGGGWRSFNSDDSNTGFDADISSYTTDTYDYTPESVTPITGISDMGEWIKIKLPEPINLTKYGIERLTGSSADGAPGKYILYASKDDSTWFPIVNKSDPITYDGNNLFEESVNSNSTFQYFALVVTQLQGARQYLAISEFYLYGRELVTTYPYSNINDDTDEDNGFSYLLYDYKSTLAEQYTNVSGWRLVRFLPDNANTFHPATDNLAGTDVYGTYNDSSNAWSIVFGTFDEFCFSTNNFNYWLYCTKTAVYGDYTNQARNIIRSSRNSSPHTKNWYNRSGEASDPWISLENHDDTTNYMVYGEASHEIVTHGALITGNGGLCVWVRDSTDVKNDYTSYELTTSNPIECDILVVAGGGAGGYDGGGGGGGGCYWIYRKSNIRWYL